MSTPWENLSANQKAAVQHEQGPSAVFAGPGSGKTRVVTLRAARLASQGRRLLVTTFTNDATQEMRQRLQLLLDKPLAERAHITTLHALCLLILKKHLPKFQLLTDEFQRRGLADASKAADLDGGVGGFLSRTSYLKNQGETAVSYKHDGSSEDMEFAFAWREFEKRKTEKGLLEFDDLILHTKAQLETNEPLRTEIATQYEQIIVDECQDMNAPQYSIVFSLAKDHKNLMLVGDLDQSLYGFRGADATTFRKFAEHPRTKIFELRENYRSTQSIIQFADSIIRQDTDRRVLAFTPTRPQGESVRWERYHDPDMEAIAVGEQILRLHSQGAKYKDTAVLFRTNAQSEALERHFTALEIPYTLREEGDFYARREVQGLLGYLNFFTTQNEKGETFQDEWLLTLLNVPNRKLSRQTAGQLQHSAQFRGKRIWDILPEFHADSLSAHKALRSLVTELKGVEARLPKIAHAGDAIRYIRQETYFDDWLRKNERDERDNDRLQNVQRMQSAAAHYPTIQGYLDAVKRVRDAAARRKAERAKKRREQDAVTLGTGHSAKGLEWRYVFGIGWSEEILPHRKAEDVNEERRIAYVIATRAKDRLAVSSIETWNDAIVAPSRFLTAAQILPSTPTIQETTLLQETPEEEFLGGLFLSV